MPQLDVSTFASQIFWLIVCFGTLYYLLSRKALPRVAEILEARQDRMAADLDQAERLRKEAEVALAKYEQVVAKAQSEAHRLLAETQTRLQSDAAARQAELEARLVEQLRAAEERIGTVKANALAELEVAAVGVAQAATERLAGVQVSEQAAAAALQAVRAEAA